MKCSFMCIVIILISFINLSAAEKKWELVKDDDRFKVYARDTDDEGRKEVKAVARMTGTVDEAEAVINDLVNYPKFMSYVEVVKVVKSEGACTVAYFQVSPPIVDDRDYTIKLCTTKSKDRVKVAWVPVVLKEFPPTKKSVRVTQNIGHWDVKKIADDEVLVEYYLNTHPGGSIPTFLINKANKTSVSDVVTSLYKEMMKRRKEPKKAPEVQKPAEPKQEKAEKTDVKSEKEPEEKPVESPAENTDKKDIPAENK